MIKQDKTKRSHIETLRFAQPDVSPGDSVSYSNLHDKSPISYYEYPPGEGSRLTRYTHAGIPCTIIESTTCGDYSGNALVGESNYRVLKESYPWLVEIYGSHGYKALAYLGKRENQSDALIETIDSLAEYPLADDSDHSNLEMETESKAWDDDGSKDFARALVAVLDEIDPEHEHDADEIDETELYDLWRDGCEAYNVNGGSGYVNEQGDSIHFYIREWCEGALRADDTRYPWSDWSRKARHDLLEKLQTVAIVARVKEAAQVSP